MRAILHVDMDAFYAAIEQRDRPELRGRPVIVGGLGPRAVGIAERTPRARALCPDAAFLAPRMARYTEVSRAVAAILERYTPEIEPLSLDEAFLDVTASRRLHGTPEAIGGAIRAAVRSELGLACSVGSAHNKLLAKLASELAKPDGLRSIAPDEAATVLDPLPVSRLWTVGPVTARRLEAAGIATIGALSRADDARLARSIGRDAALLQALARGEDARAVETERTERSISAERTFDTDIAELEDARAWLVRFCERVGARSRAAGLAGRKVVLKLRLPPFETHTRQATLPDASNATSALQAAADALLVRWWGEQRRPRLRLLGMALGALQAQGEGGAADLFAPAPRTPDAVVDRINQRFGATALRRARGLATGED